MSSTNSGSKGSGFIKKQIKELTSGDIVLHPIYRSDGLMLVNKNKELSTALIDMIKRHAPSTTSILVAPSSDALLKFIANSHSDTEEFLQELKQVDAQFSNIISKPQNIYDSILTEQRPAAQANKYDTIKGNSFADLLNKYPLWVSLGERLESEQLRIRARLAKKELLEQMRINKTFSKLFDRIRDYHDVLLIHSINTMCISLMLGLTLELDISELIDLCIAALFCNVGFIDIHKTDFLYFLKTHENIQEQLKGHLEVFSELTKDLPDLRKKPIVYGILDHHEYFNGKGYPNGKEGEEISLFGRILSIAHNYDELVGGYNFKIGMHPLDALRIIYENTEQRYDQNILNIFIHRTSYFKLGETLSLPNIQKGIIVGFDDFIKMPHLPKVRLENGTVINLAKN